QAREAHPLDATARRDQRRDLAVGQEPVVSYRRKRRELGGGTRQLLCRPAGPRIARQRVVGCHLPAALHGGMSISLIEYYTAPESAQYLTWPGRECLHCERARRRRARPGAG